MKKAAILILLSVVLFGAIGYLYASPYLALYGMQQAIQERNAEKLAAHIDFPALRQSLKEQVGAAALAAARSNTNDTSFAPAIPALAPGFIGGMIDSYVTPSGLAQLMDQNADQEVSSDDQSTLPNPDEILSEASYGFDSLSTFSVRVPHEETGEEIRLVLTRSGLDWKLSDVVLPIDQMLQSLSSTSVAIYCA